MKGRLITIAVFLLIASMATTAASKEVKKDYHETFSVAEGHRLRLVHGDGDVTIASWDRDQIDIEVRYHVEYTRVGVGSEPEFEVEFKQENNGVSVIGKEKSTTTVGFSSKKRYEYIYKIQAPAYLRLDLRGDDGDVEIESWQGEVGCSLEDGDITLTDMRVPRTVLELEDGDLLIVGFRGTLDATVEDGDVTLRQFEETECHLELEDGELLIEDYEGDLEVRTEDGDVDVRRMRAANIDIRAADGDVDLDIVPGNKLDLYVTTGDGDVKIDLAKGISATFTVDVSDGRIRLDLPGAQLERKEPDMASGTIGDGDGTIRINSDDGRVTLRQTE